MVLGGISDLALRDVQDGDSAGEGRRNAFTQRSSVDGGAAEAGAGVYFDVIATGSAYDRFAAEWMRPNPAIGGISRIPLYRLSVFNDQSKKYCQSL
jgi:hypothetical protein